MSENRKAVEIHGCIVCARLFNILAIYAPDDRLVDCTVTSPGGHRVPDERRPLVACDSHSVAEIDTAYKRWKSERGKGSARKQEDD